LPLRGCLCDLNGEPIKTADCIACAASPVPIRIKDGRAQRCRFTTTILSAIYENDERRKNAGISVTELTGCLRQTYLKKSQDYYQAPIKLWPALRGTMFHALFERAQNDKVIRERRLTRQINGLWITGQPDEIDPERKVIIDYKSKENIPDYVSNNFIMQLNLYRWLAADGYDNDTGEKIQIPVDHLGIIFVTMKDIAKRIVPTYSLDVVEEWLEPRIMEIQNAMNGGEWPSRISENPMKNKLCLDWCPVRDLCVEYGGRSESQNVDIEETMVDL
jgi:hypothetical protein